MRILRSSHFEVIIYVPISTFCNRITLLRTAVHVITNTQFVIQRYSSTKKSKVATRKIRGEIIRQRK